MSSVEYMESYKGHDIFWYRYEQGGVFKVIGFVGDFPGMPECYAAIDELEGPPTLPDVGPQGPTTPTRTPSATYRGVTVYADSDLPGLFFSVAGTEYSTQWGEADAMQTIDGLLGPLRPGEPGYVGVSPLEPITMELPVLWSWITGPLNWAKSVLEGIGSGIGGAVSGLGTAIGGIGQSIINSLTGVGKGLEGPLADAGNKALDAALEASSLHSPDPKTEVKLKALMEQLRVSQEAILKTIHQSPGDPAGAPVAAGALATALLGVQMATEIGGALLDILHPIKAVGGQRLAERMIDNLAVGGTVGEIIGMPAKIGVLPQLRYWYNSIYQPEIPPYQDLINQVVKEVITLDEFKKQMSYQGFSADWSQKIWDAHFIPPDWTQLLNAFYRGVVTREQLDSLMILVDLDPRYKNIFDAQIEQIPPYSELTNQLVKEVLTQDEYTKYLQWYGFDAKWSKRIWDAHFIPPSLSDILTAWRRGKITEEEVDKMMILVDLDPRFKEIFDTRKYVDPPLSMIRFMFETGNIDAATVKELIHLQGYRPEHEEMITNYLTEFQSRLWRRRYLVSLSQGFQKGVYSQERLEAAVAEAEYTPDVAKYIVANALVRREVAESGVTAEKPKLLSVGELKKAYIENMISRDALATELAVRGYPLDQADLLLKLLDQEKVVESAGGSKVALSQAELVDAWKYQEITEDQLRIELQLRGLSLAEVEILIRTKLKKWGVGGAEVG